MSVRSHPIRFDTNRLFRDISGNLLEMASAIPEVASFEDEEVIFREGDLPDAMYLVASGAVRISTRGRGGQQETLSYVEPDNFFGEMALLDPEPRSAQATAAQRAVLGRIDQSRMDRLLTLAPREITANLTREIVRRLRSANVHLIQEMMDAERLSVIGSMTSGIVHDLKNPMGVITGVADLLAESSDPALVKYAGMLRRASDRVLTMVQELLDFSRGTAQLHLRSVTVGHLLAELDDQVLHRLPQSGIHVEREVRYTGTLSLDTDRFIRVLLNLIKNAMEAMPSGGRLSLAVHADGDQAVFTVADTGHGIPEHILPKIFDPFVTHGKAQGTGLGMAIAKSIVEAHGGTIAVSSNPGHGTRFTIRLPRDADQKS